MKVFVIRGARLARSIIENQMLERFRSHFQTNGWRVDLKRTPRPFLLQLVLASSTCGDQHIFEIVKQINPPPPPIRIGGELERLVAASPVMTKSWGPSRLKKYPESHLVKPPKRNTRALSPACMLRGKVPPRFAAQNSRLNVPLAPMRSAPSCFNWKWGCKLD